MFKLLSGVLQLGNIEFMTAGGAQITTKQGQGRAHRYLEKVKLNALLVCKPSLFIIPVVTNASELLGLDAFQLSEVLTQRSIILRGEEICSPLTIEQVIIHTCTTCLIDLLPLLDTFIHTAGFTLIVTGCGLPGLCCYGVVFPVFLLDHPQDQSKGQRKGKL